MTVIIRESRAAWVYRGIWGRLTRWFRLPGHPPTLPAHDPESLNVFHPAPGWLRYQKFIFWILLTIVDGAIFIGWLVILVAAPPIGILLAPVALAVAILPDIVAYLVIHLRYDTTWYVLSDRSLRIRKGVWTVREMTFTFENVQNVSVTRGPLQRYFGIADVVIDTAGGGRQQKGEHGGTSASLHQGKIEGIDNAPEIRELMLTRVRRSQGAGLGDDPTRLPHPGPAWSPRHTNALREIRDLLAPASRNPAS